LASITIAFEHWLLTRLVFDHVEVDKGCRLHFVNDNVEK